MPDFPIQFDKPAWLLLLLLIIPLYLMGRRSIGGLSRAKATFAFALRVIVVLLLTTALAHPIWEKKGEGLTVSIILDRSLSVPLGLKKDSVDILKRAVEAKENLEDRVAVITVAKDANIEAMPDSYTAVTAGSDQGDLTATNLARSLQLALAIMPDDTSNRIVLVSDGNETVDSVLEAAQIARANDIPIDVYVLEYEHRREVIFERVIAPARAREGQTVNLKLALRAQNQVPGKLSLRMNGVPLDLNGEEPGTTRSLVLQAGPHVEQVSVTLDDPGPHQFDAVFEPDNATDDEITRNNQAVAVTFVGGEGKVLIIDDGNVESEYLVRALQEADIATEIRGPGGLTGGLVFLAGFDAVVMANIPRFAFDDTQIRELHAYVHDLGGGFVMLGGPNSFGAGNWIDTDVAKVLPVRLDPPQSRQMPRGALALIMHSCEMAQGNYWGQMVANAAINALSRLDYVGIVEFNWNPGVQNINGASWAHTMQPVGDRSAALAAVKKMVVGDMPDFDASMQLALNGLMSVRAGQRHAIIISDGDPSPPTGPLIQKYIDNQITVTTIMVAGHGSAADDASMQFTATKTGGRFYKITNPKNLPEIFFKEAQVVSRSLIQEGDVYQPRVVSGLPGPIEGYSEVPSLDGYVLTAPRENSLAMIPIVNPTSEGNDPIYAYWQYGLGKSIAYTSDLTGRWGGRWASWSEFQAFWEQSIRWVMRPSSPSNLLINTRLEGDLAVVELEALQGDSSFLNLLDVRAVVLTPSAEPETVSLQQTGPGRYRGEFRTGEAGAYLVNVGYENRAADNSTKGNLQAAVCVPYSREFRDVRDNAAVLDELARTTGGRRLVAGDPEVLNLFDNENLEIPKSPKQIWDVLAIFAAILFLLDVAARRVSIDPKALAALAGRAVGKRSDAGTDTVAAWKRTRSGVAHRGKKQAVVPVQAEPADRAVRFEANEKDKQAAIDVGAETPADMRTSAAPQVRKPTESEAQADDGDYTSRLLKAKRRARGDEGGDGKEADKPDA